MIVLDASVLIAHLDSTDSFHAQAGQILVDSGPESLGASSITLAEVLVTPIREKKLALVQKAIDDLGIEELPLDEESSVRLAELKVITGLKMPDCCVIAAAESRAGKVATFDRSLARAAEDLGLPVFSSSS